MPRLCAAVVKTVAKVMMVTTVWTVGYDVHASNDGFGSYDSYGRS
jgi:hypothetical protein